MEIGYHETSKKQHQVIRSNEVLGIVSVESEIVLVKSGIVSVESGMVLMEFGSVLA
jgi:hypothetical protein